MHVADIAEIRRAIERERASVVVRPVRDGGPDWQIQAGRLVNVEADYFSVRAIRQASGGSRLLLSQPEEALVQLLVTRVAGDIYLLLQLRSEPGLIDVTCMTSTVQSTESNYLQKHGGKATPYIECAKSDQRGKVVHDSLQFDWGDFYDGKVKRFRIVEVEPDIAVAQGFMWVSLPTCRRLVAEDLLITTDLRAVLATAMGILGRSPHALISPTESVAVVTGLERLDISHLQELQADRVVFQDGMGQKVSFFRTLAASREVADWVQPLLETGSDTRIALYRSDEGIERYAVRLASQVGFASPSLWEPSQPSGVKARSFRSCRTSAEGGRFYQHEVRIELVSSPAGGAGWDEGTQWLTREQIQRLVETPLATSVELRLAWSLVVAVEDD